MGSGLVSHTFFLCDNEWVSFPTNFSPSGTDTINIFCHWKISLDFYSRFWAHIKIINKNSTWHIVEVKAHITYQNLKVQFCQFTVLVPAKHSLLLIELVHSGNTCLSLSPFFFFSVSCRKWWHYELFCAANKLWRYIFVCHASTQPM